MTDESAAKDFRTPEARKWVEDYLPPETCGSIDDVQNALEHLRDANSQLRHAAHYWKRVAEDRASASESRLAQSLQDGLAEWATEAFGAETITDLKTRAMRTLEEAVELAQALGVDEEACHRQVVHTYSRPVGDPAQEIAGVINGALMAAEGLGVDGLLVAEEELHRVWGCIDEIRIKNLTKVQA